MHVMTQSNWSKQTRSLYRVLSPVPHQCPIPTKTTIPTKWKSPIGFAPNCDVSPSSITKDSSIQLNLQRPKKRYWGSATKPCCGHTLHNTTPDRCPPKRWKNTSIDFTQVQSNDCNTEGKTPLFPMQHRNHHRHQHPTQWSTNQSGNRRVLLLFAHNLKWLQPRPQPRRRCWATPNPVDRCSVPRRNTTTTTTTPTPLPCPNNQNNPPWHPPFESINWVNLEEHIPGSVRRLNYWANVSISRCNPEESRTSTWNTPTRMSLLHPGLFCGNNRNSMVSVWRVPPRPRIKLCTPFYCTKHKRITPKELNIIWTGPIWRRCFKATWNCHRWIYGHIQILCGIEKGAK